MPKAKFREGSAAEGWPGEALESEDFWDFARTGEWFQHAVSRLPEAGGGVFKGLRLCRRPLLGGGAYMGGARNSSHGVAPNTSRASQRRVKASQARPSKEKAMARRRENSLVTPRRTECGGRLCMHRTPWMPFVNLVFIMYIYLICFYLLM
jgi:hypothetical protein